MGNQAYCISTSASVDVKGADVSKIDDAFFARTKKPKSKKDGEEFFGDADEKPELKPERSAEGDRRCAGARYQEDPADGRLPQDPLLAEQGRRASQDEVLSSAPCLLVY